MAAPALVSVAKAVTTAGTRVRLVASSLLASECVIKALGANTGIIYVGGSDVASSNGFQLAAGESVSVGQLLQAGALSRGEQRLDLTDIYLDSSVNGEGVRVLYVSR